MPIVQLTRAGGVVRVRGLPVLFYRAPIFMNYKDLFAMR